MEPDAARREIDATLRKSGFASAGGALPTYTGTIRVHGKDVRVLIEFPDFRLIERPRIHLVDRSELAAELLAHIETATGICYASSVGLPFDNAKPGEAVLRMLAEAATTLERSYRGQGAAEVADEYQHYWRSEHSAWSLLPRRGPPGIAAAKLFAAERESSHGIMIAESDEIRGWTVKPLRDVLIVRSEGRIGPDGKKGAPSTLPALERWWGLQGALRHVSWSRIATALADGAIVFAFAANALVGFRQLIPKHLSDAVRRGAIRRTKLPAMLAATKDAHMIERWSVADCSLERIITRNTPESVNLAGKAIALVGCGTIGSHLARMLVQSGAGSKQPFHLFDTESLDPGNLGRHLLNFADMGKMKAEALAAELERFHPDIRITPHVAEAVANWEQLKACDLVIDVTGDWNVQCALNELFLTNRGDRLAALLHAYVFANGVAAQSFLNLGDDKACFRCLKPDFAGKWRFPGFQNDVETKFTPATCGDGTYAAFSVDSPVIAASLANRAALDWARGASGQRLRTVQVDLVKGRYQQPRSPDPDPRCPACGPLREKSE